MTIKESVKWSRILMPAIIVTVFASGCGGCKITEEQLKQIKDLRTEIRQKEEDISKKEKEKRALDGEIAAQEAKLRECTDKQSAVQSRLNKWPNSWPDYPPPPPPAPPTPVETKSTKKKSGK